MPMMETYRHYFNIDPEYISAVNERVINENPDMWKKFFPHETFIKLTKNVVSVLDRKQKLSIWVEGAYGTGKSHAVLTLKKLLDSSEADTKEYFNKYHLDGDLCSNLQRIKSSGKILTVHRYGSSSIHGDQDLVLAIQESIDRAFTEAGMENQASDSLKDSVIRYLSDPENKESFGIYVRGSYRELFGGDTVDEIIQKLSAYSDEALHMLMEKIFKVARERQIKAFTMSARDLADWIREVIRTNGLKAIVFIWDEFTEYFYNNTRNLTGFQELVEISETDPFYFILVTHVSTGLFSERDADFKKLNGRFVNPHSLISLPENIAFQLMAAAMEKNDDPEVLADWEVTTDDLQDRTRESRRLVMDKIRIRDKELRDILPIHPLTALLLKYISSAFDSNQRSMFYFIKNDSGDEIKGFQWFIDNYGPEDDNPLLTIDMLWEFFYDKGRDLLTHDIRSILDYYTRSSNKKLTDDEKRVLKTVLLLQAISQQAGDAVELFIPNERNINYAFEGSDLDGAADRCAKKLVRDKVLFQKQLGGGKFQYNAYVNEVSGEELDKYRNEIDKKTTTSLITEQLMDKTTVADAITLGGALKLRYEMRYVSSSDFDMQIKQLRNQEANFENKIVAVVCFAKDDQESIVIGKKIRNALMDGSYHMVFIDATTTPFGKDGYGQYRDEMAQSRYQQGKDNTMAIQYSNNAKDALKKWKIRISDGEFIVHTDRNPEGERATSMDMLYRILSEVNKAKFPECPEAVFHVINNMFTPNSLKAGVGCGAEQKTAGTYLSGNPATKLENALKGAWQVDRYWDVHPGLYISRLKLKVDELIRDAFERGNDISIKSIFDMLKAAPYGFMPCNLTAFLMGFLLKEYAGGSYTWSDHLTNAELDINKLKEMVTEVIQLQITPNARYKEKYIVALTNEEKAFNETASVAFGIPRSLCTSVEQTRERIRGRMKELTFPIWTLKYVLSSDGLHTDKAAMRELIDLFLGIANSSNVGGAKTEHDIAVEIGRISMGNKYAADDLKSILISDQCTEGMKTYLSMFEDGRLPALAAEIDDGGQYINVLRRKFDADAANWLWNVETAQQKIREVILEYEIICESNKVLRGRCKTFGDVVKEWCEKCRFIRISYAAARNYLDELRPFMELLCKITKSEQLLDSQKQPFLELLRANGQGFVTFYSNQPEMFKRVCAYYLEMFSEEEILEFYKRIPAGQFTVDKSSYLEMIDKKTQEYRSNQGKDRLNKLWREKTGTDSPRMWSKKYWMPVLSLVGDAEFQQAKAAFATINRKKATAAAVEKAIQYIENATFFGIMERPSELDRIFREKVIKDYAVILTDIDEVKQYLDRCITTAEPYDWIGLPEVDRRLRQMAEAKYAQSGCDRALEIIDRMDVAEVKRYLKEMIRDNMIVGMEIIKEG